MQKLQFSLKPISFYRKFFRYITLSDLREPCHPIIGKQSKDAKLEEVFSDLKSDQSLYVSAAAATPIKLLNQLAKHCKEKNLKNIKIYHMHLEGKLLCMEKEYQPHIRSASFFMGANVRKAVAEGRADSIPVFLSQIPYVMYKGIVKPDIALISCSPPDKHGFCSFGTSVDAVRAACRCSKTIIAQVNEQMPRTFGESLIHLSQIDKYVRVNEPLPDHPVTELDDVSKTIGKLIAENLIENGSTIQMGIGNIPNAALTQMLNHKDLGIHTEMFSDGLIDLCLKGCVTNKFKKIHTGKTITSFSVGSKRLYDFIDNNPFIEYYRVEYVNDPRTIAKMPKMIAINSCIEVDLTGQVCSDSIGTRMFSGFGGQVDFIYGAGNTEDLDGKPIIAMPSESKGRSKIVPLLKPGAGVVTSRAHARYIVTEHGIAELFGKTLLQRAYELIKIAPPHARESLEKAAFERFKAMPAK